MASLSRSVACELGSALNRVRWRSMRLVSEGPRPSDLRTSSSLAKVRTVLSSASGAQSLNLVAMTRSMWIWLRTVDLQRSPGLDVEGMLGGTCLGFTQTEDRRPERA